MKLFILELLMPKKVKPSVGDWINSLPRWFRTWKINGDKWYCTYHQGNLWSTNIRTGNYIDFVNGKPSWKNKDGEFWPTPSDN